MTKYISGPWDNSGFCRGKAYIFPNTYHIRANSGRVIIAAVPDKKNVSIIQTAPEMYQLLCKLYKEQSNGMNVTDNQLDAIHAVLKKAEGKH